MKHSHLVVFLAGLAAAAVLAADASAMYHPTTGCFMQRDPIGYKGGMGLYEYGASAPTTNTDPRGLNAAMPEHPDAVELPPPQYYTDTPAPATVLNKQANLRLEVETIAAGGSIELGTGGPQVAMVDAGFLLSLGHAFNRWWYGVEADIAFKQHSDSTLFLADLEVSVSADRPTEWQICPAFTWRLTVHNVCCMSEMVHVITYSEQEPGAKAVVPSEGVFPLPLKGDPLLLSPDTRLEIIQLFTKRAGTGPRRDFRSSARVLVAVQCVE